ncbi:surface lipoprotein assembly modifier [Psychrobacter sp. I-STPA6b]|uniref:surface lipoprotein assembly modifier n=1 Tax=Psychrobacter sp. I-STPA6b TaxID=2585718 RepID=UPI001D0C4D7A|nr:surface lipoprotein assembly modifier [Psychrobacter sp. I-STPA6b]
MQNFHANHRYIATTALLCLLTCAISYGHANTTSTQPTDITPKPADIASQQLNNDLPIASPEQNDHQTIPTPINKEQADNAPPMDVNADYLLAHPQLLQQAMISVIAQQHMSGIQELLPIYEQWSGHDADTLLLAKGMLARYQNKPKVAITAFNQLIEKYPQNDVLHWQLALALIENRQFKEADAQLEHLENSKQIPNTIINQYRQLIAQQDKLQWQLSGTVVKDNNINRAPDEKHYGRWTFDDPISDHALSYSLQLSKQWQQRHGFFTQAQAGYSAKQYFKEHDYNDNSLRLSAGLGWADAKQQYLLAPVWSYRLYGNKPYNQSIGIRGSSRFKITDNDYLYGAVEVGQVKHEEAKRKFLDNHNYLASATWLHALDNHQSISAGLDYYRQYKTRDGDDSYRQKGLRANWQKQWQQGQGISSQLGASYHQRDYEGASFFSNQQNRADKEYSINASLWHEKLNFAGVIFPKLTFQHQRLDSNDASKSYTINNVGAELEMRF